MSTLEHWSSDLEYLVSLAAAVTFSLLAISATVKALRRQAGPRLGWIAAAFSCLALFLLNDAVLEEIGVQLPDALNADIVVVLAFPYLLLRFTRSFRKLPRWLEWACGAAAVAILVTTVTLPALTPGGGLPTWLVGYLLAAFVYWGFVSSVTVSRFWSAGRGQPTLARRRMRLMSIATAVLAATLLAIVVSVSHDSELIDLVVQGAILLSALAFGIGFSPPSMVRAWWVQPEQQRLLDGTMRVLRAETVDDVARQLLPPTARMVGAAGAALVDAAGTVVAGYGAAPPPGTSLPSEVRQNSYDVAAESISLQGHGQLVVWTSAYAPFFGRDEMQLLRAMAAVAALALERLALLEEERQQRVVLEQARVDAELARQEATTANLAKSEFLSRMSHELRTPLNAVLGFGQLLELAPLAEDDHVAVEHILVAGRHLLALIDDVLDISRVQAGTMTISVEPVNSGELVDDALALIRPFADKRSIRLRVDHAEAGSFVHADRQRARQVLLNLLSNAVKYNRDGGQITVLCEPHDGDWVRISIRDTGPGISVGGQQRLFEPFQRLGAEASGVEGTGLGLSVSQQLIHAMGGRIGVVSEPGSGSTFWIDLPGASEPVVDFPHPAPDVQPATGDGSPERQAVLLLIEDNLTNLRVMEAMLRLRDGLTVLSAQTGLLGLQLAQEHQPDVIVLDLHLPDLPGHDVLRRLQADPRTCDIPVIIASADAMPGRAELLEQDGAVAYLTKPVELDAFLDAVDAAVTCGDLARLTAGGEVRRPRP